MSTEKRDFPFTEDLVLPAKVTINILRAKKPKWVLLGKGPTFSRRGEFDLTAHAVFGLNDTVCQWAEDGRPPMEICHFSDIEAVGRTILATKPDDPLCPRYVVMPFYPHLNCRPDPQWPLEQILTHGDGKRGRDRFPPGVARRLRDLAEAHKLLTYKSSHSSRLPHPEWLGPSVKVKFFSAVAAVNLMAESAVEHIDTLGIDGGSKYAKEFDYMDPLRNEQPHFDRQFAEIDKTVKRYKIHYTALGGKP